MTAVNKKKQLTENQRELMRRSLQKFAQDNVVIVYGFAKKQSGSGLFSNERLILLHSGQRSIRYYSKQPADLPYDKLSEIANGKAKVLVDKVTNFKCESIKTSTVKIQWDQGSAHNLWQFSFQNAKMAHQWVAAVQQMIAGKINKDPTFAQPTNKNPSLNSPIGNLSPLLNSNAQPLNSSKLNEPVVKQPDPQVIPKTNSNNNASFILTEPPKPPQQPNNINNSQNNQQTQGQPVLMQNSQVVQPNQYDKSGQQTVNQPATQPKFQQPIQSQSGGQPMNQSVKKPYTDVASEIRDLRSKEPQRFQLTNDLSKKNLTPDVNSQPNLSNDNVQTKRDPSSSQPSNISFKKNQPQPGLLRPEPAQSGQSANSSLQNSRGNFQSSQQSRVSQQQPSIASKKNQPEFSNPSKTGSQAYGPESNPISRVESIPNINNNKPAPARNQTNKPPSVRNKTASTRKWNELWCTVGNQIQIYEQFVKCCQDTAVSIIDELPLLKANRQYIPIRFQGPYFLYDVAGITFNMHFFEDSSPLESSRDADQRAPLLFEQESYYEAKRQFYNLNFVLGVTGNKGLFKVPLSCYIEYKGVLIFCKANAPEGFDKVSPHFYERQLQQLQDALKMRFIFNSMVVFAHPQKKYFLLMDLDELIPRIPIDVHPPVYFRRQFLMENSFMIEDQNSVKKLYQNLTSNNIKEFINRCETLQLWVISSVDLAKQLHRAGISLGCLPLIYEETNLSFLKKIIVSEMTKTTFCDILRSQLNSVYSSFPAKEFDELNLQYTDKIILDCAHILLNELFSYSSRSENIWRMIVKQVNKKFKVVISKEDILAGYLLGGIMDSIGIDCDYKTPELNRKESFFIRKSSLPRQLLLNFYPKLRRYDLQSISPLYCRTLQLLQMQPNPDNFQQLVRSLNLKSKPIPSFLSHLQPQIVTYMCNFIPLGQHDQFQHIGIYDMLQQQPHTYCSTKVCLLGIKWAAKKKNQELANKIFQVKYQENGYWVSQFNPAISQYYDFFSLYNVSTGNYEESIKLARSSLVNSIKLSGANSLPVADKHYQLGNIEFKIGQKEEALKQYLKTKQILEQHRQTSIPEYGIILLKLALLYLNFGKIGECVGNSVAALKIFDTNGGSEQQEIQTFEILSRSYQITRKAGDLKNVGLLCSEKFNNTENCKIFERMVKIVLLPKLASLSHEDAKTLLKLTAKIQQLDSPISNLDCFNYLHSRAESQVIMKRVFSFLDNISNLYEEAMRKDLFRKHKALLSQARSQASDMIVLLQAIFVMTGFNFVNGSLRENYY